MINETNIDKRMDDNIWISFGWKINRINDTKIRNNFFFDNIFNYR